MLMTLVRSLVSSVLLAPLAESVFDEFRRSMRVPVRRSVSLVRLVLVLVVGPVPPRVSFSVLVSMLATVLVLWLVPGRTPVLVGLLWRWPVVRRLFGLVLLLGTVL